ncbi:MAG: tRNA (adenosine(37)-N6)-dimethylallyltransferase MiaA [Planctomycetota bacterium]|nr:tRNA (adenosine(37)-N6)-dimethylallyltransferase MiaA [Planctomycetota bacterium]
MTVFPVIIGPTASGKSGLALELARRLSTQGRAGEIVSADSMQIYRGLDIGSAKAKPREQRAAPHHLIDICEPTESFSVDAWLRAAERCIAEIRSRGGLPIVVGGTHLYIKALLEGLFEGPAADPAIRSALQAMDPRTLRNELERVDPAAAARIHPNDSRRTIRALEVFRQTGRPISELQQQWDAGRTRSDALLVTLEWDTAALAKRINARVKGMVQRGLVEEVRGLLEAGRLGSQAGEGIGYKQIAEAMEAGETMEDAIERVKIESRRLAKNQRTWIRRLRAERIEAPLDAGEGFFAEHRGRPLRIGFDPEAMGVEQMAQVVADHLLAMDRAGWGEGEGESLRSSDRTE